METLTLEELKICMDEMKAGVAYWSEETIEGKTCLKAQGLFEQMIKDKEFERDQTTLPKI